MSRFTRKSAPRLPKIEGGGFSQFGQCPYLDCFYFLMASLIELLEAAKKKAFFSFPPNLLVFEKLSNWPEVFPKSKKKHEDDILFDLHKKCIFFVICRNLGLRFLCGNSSSRDYPFAEILQLFASLSPPRTPPCTALHYTTPKWKTFQIPEFIISPPPLSSW